MTLSEKKVQVEFRETGIASRNEIELVTINNDYVKRNKRSEYDFIYFTTSAVFMMSEWVRISSMTRNTLLRTNH